MHTSQYRKGRVEGPEGGGMVGDGRSGSIPPYTSICLLISNIRNMRANMRATNCHISIPRPFPKVRI